jgi:hypothetical protein
MTVEELEASTFGGPRLAVIRQPDDPEKYEGSVLAEHFLGALRISAHPLPDAFWRHLVARDNVTLNKNAADWHEWIAVMAIVVDADYGARVTISSFSVQQYLAKMLPRLRDVIFVTDGLYLNL